MSVLVNEKTRVIVQGFTGREGSFHAAADAIAYGTKVVARRDAGQGRNDASGRAGVQHGGRGGEARPARTPR